MKPKRTTEPEPSSPKSAPIMPPPVLPAKVDPAPDKTQTAKLVPGVNVFCVD